MSRIDDVVTQFEVPISAESHASSETAERTGTSEPPLSLAQLFGELNEQNEFSEYTTERMSLESVFLKVIRAHNMQEENTVVRWNKKRFWIF